MPQEEGNRGYLFPKKERITSLKKINAIFQGGKSCFHYPFKVYYIIETSDHQICNQTAISVPKRAFKKAVDRNRIKRLFRESYRVQHPTIMGDSFQVKGKSISTFFIYQGKKEEPFDTIESGVKKILHSLLVKENAII